MSEIARYVETLEDALDDLPDDADAMLISELDGFVTGLAVMPVVVPSAEWLPHVWRRHADTPDYIYHDRELLDEIAELATRHARTVERDLHRGDLAPIYEIDSRNDETMWEIWMEGFDRALSLREDAFDALEQAGEDERDAFDSLYVLSLVANGEMKPADTPSSDDETGHQDVGAASGAIAKQDYDRICADAPDLIPAAVATLYRWSRSRRPVPDFAIPVRSSRVGRNDPCTCGSGRKYKKCCGAA